jgi:putative ABC transport system permease protein
VSQKVKRVSLGWSSQKSEGLVTKAKEWERDCLWERADWEETGRDGTRERVVPVMVFEQYLLGKLFTRASGSETWYVDRVSLLRSILSAIRLALLAIWRSKVRATLTVLGILIGVAAVVTVSALGVSARNSIGSSIESLGSNLLYIFPRSTNVSGAKGVSSGRLTEQDGDAIASDAPSVKAITPFTSTIGQVVYGENNVSTSLAGVNRDYFDVRKFKIESGRSWTVEESRTKAKVGIIGHTVSDALFGDEDPIGRVVRIGLHPFVIIGVIERKGASTFGEDQDDRIIMPSSTFRARIRPGAPGRVGMLIASATDARTVERAQSQIDSIMRQRHHIGETDELDYSIHTQAEFRERQEQVLGILSILLISIAGISLFVGGIGVMNIMLVSVTERTREIGIRMAIGASSSDILIQFLVEAIVLTMLGGVVGTLLGVGAIYAFSQALKWQMTVPVDALLLALGTCVLIGVLFGFLPARRAANLDPIEALRQE